MLLTPGAERGPLVVDEDAAIFHRRPVGDASFRPVELILMCHGRIGHPVPGGYADAARNLVDAVDGAALVITGYNKIPIHYVNQIRLPMALDGFDVKLLLLDEPVDELALPNRSGIYRGER